MSTEAASTRPRNQPPAEAQSRERRSEFQSRDRLQDAPTRPMRAMDNGRREQMSAPDTETKNSFLTTEFWIYAGAVTLVVISAFWRGSGTNGLNINDPILAWWFLSALTAAYLISRGLAKAGSDRRLTDERGMARR